MVAPSLPGHALAETPLFGRMFPNLPPWTPPPGTSDVDEYLWDLAESLYLPTGQDSAGNPKIPAGYTYFGQFINHDITFDATSSLRRPARPHQLRSRRTPRFDLDCVYGDGPREQPYLYCSAESGRLLLGQNENGEVDLPRNRDASSDAFSTDDLDRWRPALIGDPRNDDNIMVSQLHLAVLRFHNLRLAEIRKRDLAAGRGPSPRQFAEARQVTRWHYQWVVIHDFLTRFCGSAEVNRLLDSYGRPNERDFAFPTKPFVPIEFSLGAFRAGHSMVSSNYALNDVLLGEMGGNEIEVFGPEHPSNNLIGGRELPARWSVQWDRFLKLSQQEPKPSRALDTQLVAALRDLPIPIPQPRERSLAYLTLRKGWLLRMPSGQSIAEHLGLPIHAELQPGNDPLWHYVLREAELVESGERLGPLGARIAASVVVEFLVNDPDSYFRHDPDWTPTLEGTDDRFELADFIRHSGAPLEAGDWEQKSRAETLLRGSQSPSLPVNG